tara:strand:- start:50062 stop:50547 length:486 start_codon:yes stop_codon:yes gene_type:complete
MNIMPTIEGMSLMNKNELTDAINDFNQKYARYVLCNSSTENPDNTLNCRDEEMDKEYVLDAYETAKEKIKTLQDAPVKGDITLSASFKREFDEMVKEHKDLQKMRNDLAIMDTEVGENSSSKMNTMGEDFEEEYRYTMYVNMMLTVLGTTMLYYIFFKWNK